MCRHYPGTVLAFGQRGVLEDARGTLSDIGDSTILDLITEAGELEENPFLGYALLELRVDEGDELYASTALASFLGPRIRNGEAAVDLDHLLPMSGGAQSRSVRLSGAAERWLRAIREEVHPMDSSDLAKLRIGILDSGIDPEYLRLRRPWNFVGYDARGAFVENAPPTDPVLHGTRVAKILDDALPEQVPFSIARLPAAGALNDIRVSSFTCAYADFIAREAPSVCNVSIGPVPDSIECPQCRRPIEATWLASTILPALFRLAETATFTVMAAGNGARYANTRWRKAMLERWILAVASDEAGRRTPYSVSFSGADADIWQAQAFGGTREASFFEGEPIWGTSFAAPLVTALAARAVAGARRHSLPEREAIIMSARRVLWRMGPWD